jgi:hypothetical protein
MKTNRFPAIRAFSSFLVFGIALGASSRAQQPTFTLLYTFQKVGGTPVSMLESSPGNFLGVMGVSPGVFAINSAGTLEVLYYFPVSTEPFPLVSSLNGKAYGSASSLGSGSLEELFWVGAKGAVSTLQYNGATQGGPYLLVQSPDTYLYSFFDVVGVFIPTFARLGTNGEPITLYTFTAAQGLPQVLFLGPCGDFYGLTSMSNGTALASLKSPRLDRSPGLTRTSPTPVASRTSPG